MSDRELLELAAKAAGIQLRFLGGETPFSDGPNRIGEWNPLTDDGDALRLAVVCGLVVDCSRPSAGEPFKTNYFAQEDFTDRGAATRRAIVRAAASLAQSKEQP